VRYVPAAQAAADFGFVRDYIARLARIGKIRGRKIGANWYVEYPAFQQFVVHNEHERAARFHFARDRRHFVTGRSILRRILGHYLQHAPEDLAFAYGLRGKPMLPGTGLQFNLADSDGLALLAVTRGGAIGIDLERIRPVPNYDHLMKSFFSAAEIMDYHRDVEHWILEV